MKMEAQKIVNLLNSPENEYSKLATKKWYGIGSESKGGYLHEDPIEVLIKLIESSDLVTGNITYCCYKNYCCAYWFSCWYLSSKKTTTRCSYTSCVLKLCTI